MSLKEDLSALSQATAEQQRRTALAFQAVFGQENSRNSDQRIVAAILKAQCGQDKALPILDHEGRIDASSAVFYEGGRRIHLFIEGQLGAARAQPINEPVVKSKTKR